MLVLGVGAMVAALTLPSMQSARDVVRARLARLTQRLTQRGRLARQSTLLADHVDDPKALKVNAGGALGFDEAFVAAKIGGSYACRVLSLDGTSRNVAAILEVELGATPSMLHVDTGSFGAVTAEHRDLCVLDKADGQPILMEYMIGSALAVNRTISVGVRTAGGEREVWVVSAGCSVDIKPDDFSEKLGILGLGSLAGVSLAELRSTQGGAARPVGSFVDMHGIASVGMSFSEQPPHRPRSWGATLHLNRPGRPLGPADIALPSSRQVFYASRPKSVSINDGEFVLRNPVVVHDTGTSVGAVAFLGDSGGFPEKTAKLKALTYGEHGVALRGEAATLHYQDAAMLAQEGVVLIIGLGFMANAFRDIEFGESELRFWLA